MIDLFNKFKALHEQPEPLLIGNIWSVQSAKALEKCNVKAIGTSSAAVAAMLGYKDGEGMPFDEYYFVVKRITSSTSLPLTVDLEAGYGKDVSEIANNISKLATLGVSGINLEDSVVANGVREIIDSNKFSDKLSSLTDQLQRRNVSMFINLRCDAFLLGLSNAREEAIKRIRLYEKAGVHGIFLPCITEVDDIKAVVASTSLPINVMCMPQLPGFKVLQSLGVKRISMGNFVNQHVYNKMESVCREIITNKSFSTLF